jgi:hypothetical protein
LVTGGFVTGGLVTGGFVTGGFVTGGLVTGGLVTGGFVPGIVGGTTGGRTTEVGGVTGALGCLGVDGFLPKNLS